MSLVTGNVAIDALVYGSWKSQPHTAASLSYSFLQSPPGDASGEDRNGFAPMSEAQRQAVREALQLWSNVANLTFSEVTANGTLQFGTNRQDDSSAYAYLPESWSVRTEMYLNNTANYNTVFTPGSYGPSVLLHEIGHMLGLKHPGHYDSSGAPILGAVLPAAQDNGDYTQMSYTRPTATAFSGKYALTPMLYDVQAIQYLYGANLSYRAGDDVYQFTANSAPQCIWDAGGTNTFDFSACSGQTLIDLRPGGFSNTAAGYHNIALAYGVVVTHAIAGDGGSVIYSGAPGSHITGGAGADTVYLGAGDDRVLGGAGNDRAVFAGTFASYVLQRDANGVTVLGEGRDVLAGVETLVFSDRVLAAADLPLAPPAPAGTPGADRVALDAASSGFDGGDGRDTVLYAGARADYQVAAVAGGYLVTDLVGSGGADLLVNVETLLFGDRAVSLEPAGLGGQVYRMYQAALDREPDQLGLGFWIAALERGTALQSIAQGFINSPEFQARFGAMSDTEFATLMYRNALDREPDAAGLAWHVAHLGAGMARAAVLLGFSESPENHALVIGQIQNGMDYLPFG